MQKQSRTGGKVIKGHVRLTGFCYYQLLVPVNWYQKPVSLTWP